MIAGASQQQIQAALAARDFAGVRQSFAATHPADVAEFIENLEEEGRAILFRVLPRTQAADVFEYLSADAQEGLIKALAHEHVAAILNEMSPDDRTALLEELPAAVTRQLLTLLSPEERLVARQLLGYPEKSIGRLMTPDFVAVRVDWTVQQALDHIRRQGRDSETLNVIYVVNENGKLIDDLRIRQLLLADPGSLLTEIVDGQFVGLKATDDQEAAVQVFTEYDRVAFPVTDTSGVLLGIVTVDDVLDVIQEETTEDIHKIGGLGGALEQPYMDVRFFEMMRKRAGWLMLLFLGQSLTLTAMGFLAIDMARAAVMVLFVPLIISSGGNSGSQAATLVIRAMALGEVELADWWKVMRREVLLGLSLGVLLAVLGFLRIGLGSRTGGYGEDWAVVGVAVGLSLICVVLWGVLIGSMLPFLLRRLGADPATSSNPFIATICDVTGLLIYFTVVSLILG